MIGIIVYTTTIIIGNVTGSIIRKGIKDQYKDTLWLVATGLVINSIVQNMPRSN